MKVRTERAALAEALTWVAHVIPKAPSVAALGGVHVTADTDGLTLRAYDYDVAHRMTIEAEVGEPGACLVPGLFLRDAAAGGRGSTTELALDAGLLTVTSGRSTYRIRELAVEDYPTLPDFPPIVGEIAGDALAYAYAGAVSAVDDRNVHDNLQGLRLEGDDDGLTLVGLDRPRVHVATVDAWAGKPFAATVRAADFGSAIKGMSGPITIGADDSLLGLTDGTRSVTARVIASEYAAWRKVVDSTVARAKHKIEVDGSDLFAAVRQAGSLVRDQAPLDLVYAEGELTVSTGQEIGDGHEVLPATGRGDFALRFSPRFLADGLAATTGGTVELHYGKGGKASPIVIKDPAWPGLTVVVMSRSAQ